MVAIFTNRVELFSEIEGELQKLWGAIDFKGPPFLFNHTDYYEQEMGTNLRKEFISFQNLINPESLASIKLTTNQLEERYSEEGGRIINIDPGYISSSKLVLASTKNYYHRIYLGGGIYAEVTLFFKKGTFKPLPWTYPDYRTDESISIFNRIREIYRKQL
ncbi:MAG TPA: DUF4416 family protein [Candidatus Omnitrophica bacterium]|nr:DUF4416 family protein [Candidatus Omnitrophota bacterium]